MTEYKKRNALWIAIAVAAELIILTDSLSGRIAEAFTSDTITQAIIAYPLTYIFWITGILLIRAFYKRHLDIQFPYKNTPERSHILLGLLLLAIDIALTSISWGGLKIYKELTHSIQYSGLGLGIAHFAAQHIYYVFEVILMTILTAFAQEAGESLFKSRMIPYGAIALAVLWGLVHIVWHGPVDGLLSTLNALMYGLAYLVMRKNPKYAFTLIFFMFIL